MRHRPGWRPLVGIGLAAIAALLLLAAPASAAQETFTVDSNGDQADSNVGDGVCDVGAGVCTLRAAIQEANANVSQADVIDFSGVSGQIVLASPLPQITDSVTINGPGAAQLAVDGDNSFRVLDISSGVTALISALTIQHGQAPASATLSAGGGIVSSGDVTLDRVVVTDNHAAVTGAAGAIVNAFGGGIEAAGTMTLTQSTVKNNGVTATATGADAQASGQGGGIWLEGGTLHVARSTIDDNQANATVNAGSGGSLAQAAGGGIWTFQGDITINQSTIAGNSATTAGGTNAAIANFSKGAGVYQDNQSTLTVTGVTIADNGVSTPGGPHDFGVGANVDLLSGGTFRDTIVAEPVAAPNCAGGPYTSSGFNLEDDAPHSCNFIQGTDIPGQDPQLGALANNGGPTETMELLSGSPAIDQGNSFGATTDQRGTGFPRISDSPAITNAGDGSDIGAFERDVAPPTVSAPVQSLVKGSQLGTSKVPVRLAWSASDDVTPAAQIQSFLQMRTNSGGTWSPFANLVGPTLAKSAMPSLSGSTLRQFRVRANDQAGNIRNGPAGPPFRVTTLQETSPAIAYAGTWRHADQGYASGGGVQFSTQAGAKATLTSTGRNLAVVMPLRSTEGTVRICLDPGTSAQGCATVDLSPATGLGSRKVVFARNGLSPTATHKVVVTVLSGRADLDAFVALR